MSRGKGREWSSVRSSHTCFAKTAKTARASSTGTACGTRAGASPFGWYLHNGPGPGAYAVFDLGSLAGSRDFARGDEVGLPNATYQIGRTEVPGLRGILFQERARLHLALLHHPDG